MRKCLLVFILYLLFCRPMLGAEEEEFVYDDNGKRDPFRPLITDKGTFGIGISGIETIDDITLEGIVWDEAGGSFAIINGIIMKENDQVNNVKLVKISSNAVLILIGSEKFTINLIKEEEE